MVIRVNSHRAREKMVRALGYNLQSLYSMWIPGEFYEVTDTDFEKLRGIKGINKSRVKREELQETISLI